MFGTQNSNEESATAKKQNYVINVDSARTTKNDAIVMIDLDVNGVKIKSCMLKEITVKQDGEKYKKGDICYVINFPSEKNGNKYYNRVWFPVSNDDLNGIIEQVKEQLAKA